MSGYLQDAAVIDGLDAWAFAHWLPRALLVTYLNRAGVGERQRESILRSHDAICRAAAAWERGAAERLARSEAATSEPASGSELRFLPAMVSTITTGEAAMRLGCSESYVRRLLKSDRLSGRRDGHAWRVNEAAVDAMAAERAALAA